MPDVTYVEDIMMLLTNLISLEEHFGFTAQKIPKMKEYYLKLVDFVRQMRISIQQELGIRELPDELPCSTKHLLASAKRAEEVGTRFLKDKNMKKAIQYFDYAYSLYNLFLATLVQNEETRRKIAGLKSDKKVYMLK